MPTGASPVGTTKNSTAAPYIMGITFTTVPDVISFDIPKNMSVPPFFVDVPSNSSSPTSLRCQRKSLGIMELLGFIFWES